MLAIQLQICLMKKVELISVFSLPEDVAQMVLIANIITEYLHLNKLL
jgi:hypothetical protein